MSMTELNRLILKTIDKIRYSHRNRPSFEKIFSYLNRMYSIEMSTFETQLELLINEGKVLPQTFNGKLSYRNVLTWNKAPRHMKDEKNLAELLSANSSRRSSVADTTHSDDSHGSEECEAGSNNVHSFNNKYKIPSKRRSDENNSMDGKDDIVETKRQRKKKVIYDPADYDVPVIRKKKKNKKMEANSSDSQLEDEVDDDGTIDLLGGFTRRVMFPENMNMCSECHRFMSGIKPDPMVSCTTCSNESHQSCTVGKITGKSWYCNPCRREGKDKKTDLEN